MNIIGWCTHITKNAFLKIFVLHWSNLATLVLVCHTTAEEKTVQFWSHYSTTDYQADHGVDYITHTHTHIYVIHIGLLPGPKSWKYVLHFGVQRVKTRFASRDGPLMFIN